jgi:Ran GTPase-activating protein (RanGAP) involved in mRNA processing and transport
MESPLQAACLQLRYLSNDEQEGISLDLSNRGLTDTDAVLMSKTLLCLASRCSIDPVPVSLDLSHNRLGPYGAFLICKALRYCDGTSLQLTSLDMSHNRISTEGAAAVARLLMMGCRSLTTLRLDSNQIGNEGCLQLLGALMTRESGTGAALEELSLHDNFLGTASAVMLANLLEYNSSLKRIRLGRNKVGPDGYRALRDVLRDRNTTLHTLDLPESVGGVSWSAQYKRDIRHYTQLNYHGRRCVRDIMMPAGFYPHVLSRVSRKPALMLDMLSERPDLLSGK